MKLKQVILNNFRSYSEEIKIDINDLTVLIGRNDKGKSSILEALEIFFNNKAVKIDKDDACKDTGNPIVRIGCVFTDLPTSIVLDAEAATSLADDYLLNADGDLEIHQIFDCSKGSIKSSVSAVALHPSVAGLNDLLELKNTDLKKRLKDAVNNEQVDQRKNPEIRKALWGSAQDLQLTLTELSLDKEDAKKIWANLQAYLPIFALFKSDRPSTDEDAEVQDPMKLAVAEAIKSVSAELEQIKAMVQDRATDVAKRTLEKLNEMAPDLAGQLNPQFKAEPKWDSLFKLTLTGDQDVPINKRGSGVRRLILLNFFRAEVERRREEAKSPGVIYAIEEPETSQHPTNQRLLVEALQDLAEQGGCQVLMTTHVPELGGMVPLDSLRYISGPNEGVDRVRRGSDAIYQTIADDLGVLPDKRTDDKVKVIICVEGPHDVTCLKHMSHCLHKSDPVIPDLSAIQQAAILPVGGGTLHQWVNHHYLKGLSIPEIHIYDRDDLDPPKYLEACNAVNARGNGDWATLTKKREMENYLHPDLIKARFDVDVELEATTDIPKTIMSAVNAVEGHPLGKLNEKRTKRILNEEVAKQMTAELLSEIDQDKEVIGWFTEIQKRLV